MLRLIGSVCTLLCLTSLPAKALVSEYKLDNGLRIFVKEDHRAPVVASEVWYKIGGSYEYGGVTGISHMLEHMMFKGTQKVPPGQFSKIVAENGGQQNAFTGQDYTGYYQFISKDKLPISFELEADRMRGLKFDQKEFDKELQVVIEERRMRTDDNPQGLTYERFMAAAHVASPYYHPVVGWMSELQRLTLVDVQTWYQNWYAPNNATLVVVGDVKPAEVYELAKRYFGPLPKKELAPLKQAATITPLGKREIIVKTPAKLPWLIMGYNVPVLKTTSTPWEAYALDVISGILDGGTSARFTKDLVRKQQVVTSAEASYDPFDRLDSLFTIDATPAAGKSIADVKKAILAEIERLQTQRVTTDELARVKAQVVASKVYQKDSILAQAREIGKLESIGLSWRDGDAYVKNIQAVTPLQILEVAKKYLIADRLTIAVLEPLPLDGKRIEEQFEVGGGGNVH